MVSGFGSLLKDCLPAAEQAAVNRLRGEKMNKVFKKWTTVVLAVVLTVAFMPAGFGALGVDAPGVDKAYAGGEGLGSLIRGGTNDGGKYVCCSGDRIYVTMQDLDDKFGGNFSTMYNNKEIECYFDSRDPGATDGKKLAAFYDSSTKQFYYKVHPNQYGKELTFFTRSTKDYTSDNRNTSSVLVTSALNFSISKGGIVTVTGNSMDHAFSNVKVDGGRTVLPSGQVGKKSVSFTFSVTDRTKYSVGRHSIVGYLDNSTTCEPLAKIPVSIYVKPTLKKSMFETNKSSVTFSPGSFNSAAFGDMYIDIKKGTNGKWSTQWGPFGPGSSGKLKKTLTPSSTYYVRAYYVKKVGGEYYLGPDSAPVAIKTGPKSKPAVKSIKITKARVKKVKVKGKYYWDNGTLKYLKGFTTYETKYKVTIKFKKKQRVAGIEVYAGGVTLPKFIKGSKKTYTTTFTVNGKAKGKKTKFKIRTKGNKAYGAWSPIYKSKRVRIK